jgi:hypothetical protein
MNNQWQRVRALMVQYVQLIRSASILGLVTLSTSLPCGCSKPAEKGYFPEDRYGLKQEYTLVSSGPRAGVRKGRLVFLVEGKKTIHGKEYFREVTEISGIPGAKSLIQYRRWDQHGIYVIDGVDQTQTDYLETPLPVKVGDSWTVKSTRGEVEYHAEKIETIQLPGRKYENCLKLSYQDQAGSGCSYYAPGIGQVAGVLQRQGVTVEMALNNPTRQATPTE